MIDIVYANAYKEVIEVLKHVSKEDYDKIPQDKINLFKNVQMRIIILPMI